MLIYAQSFNLAQSCPRHAQEYAGVNIFGVRAPH
jgi:hypothetical protein